MRDLMEGNQLSDVILRERGGASNPGLAKLARAVITGFPACAGNDGGETMEYCKSKTITH
jgi:hypothetical protein